MLQYRAKRRPFVISLTATNDTTLLLSRTFADVSVLLSVCQSSRETVLKQPCFDVDTFFDFEVVLPKSCRRKETVALWPKKEKESQFHSTQRTNNFFDKRQTSSTTKQCITMTLLTYRPLFGQQPTATASSSPSIVLRRFILEQGNGQFLTWAKQPLISILPFLRQKKQCRFTMRKKV
ncbi:expressed unknown protein [Seminavis robusta]|uniref:Uncharacterized protein n=1 Tax=Seminavis robusta TaxID=568900 RepID=A0A9N8HYD6_9STRA|nr:expressed unknown protein [Seminavis robusta]|eukprot:Sro2810_g337591.1  (178) ;mRNA; r:8625-9158